MITFDETFLQNPYETWKRLRQKGPVHQAVTPDGSPVWLVVDDEHVRALAADGRLTVDRRHARRGYTGFSLPAELDRNLLNMDGADHRRIRRRVAAGFTPARVATVEPMARAIAEALATELHAELNTNGSADLMSSYASPFALRVIGAFLGVPESALPQFRSWTDELLAPSSKESAAAAVKELHCYIIDIVSQLQEAPTGSFLGTLISNSDGSDHLTDPELTSAVFLLLFAGYENTVRAIGNGLIAAADEGGDLSLLRTNLAESDSTRTVINELLRYDPPPQLAIRRFALEDIEISGTLIPRGDTVMLSWASANHDSSVYSDPGAVQYDRTPNQHLTFGHGVHSCLGATLAHVEIGIGLTTLLEIIPRLRLLEPGDYAWRGSFRDRGVLSLGWTRVAVHLVASLPVPAFFAPTSLMASFTVGGDRYRRRGQQQVGKRTAADRG